MFALANQGPSLPMSINVPFGFHSVQLQLNIQSIHFETMLDLQDIKTETEQDLLEEETENNSDEELVSEFKVETEEFQNDVFRNVENEVKNLQQFATANEKRYQCQWCQNTFPNKGSLDVHFRSVHAIKEKPFQCPQCGKSFTSKGGLSAHKLIHSGEKPYQCKNCQRRFFYKSRLMKHEIMHTGEKPFHCQICQKRFVTKQVLVKHQQRIHNTVCESEEKTSRPFQVESSNEKPCKCTICYQTFDSQEQLSLHLKSHFSGNDLVIQPIAKAARATDGPLQCQENMVTIPSRQMMDYANSQPPMFGSYFYYPVPVPILNQFLFAPTGNLRATQKIVAPLPIHNIYQPTSVNPVLPMPHSNQQQPMVFRSDERQVYNGEKPYIITTEDLKHSKDGDTENSQENKPHQCSTCGKHYSNKFRLKLHMQVHTGEKPYKCSYCEVEFGCPSNRRRHEKVHSGEKPFECTGCMKRFARSDDLKKHYNYCKLHDGNRANINQSQDEDSTESESKESENPNAFEKHDASVTKGDENLESKAFKERKEKPSAQLPFQCDLCPKSYSSRQNLLHHCFRHSKQISPPTSTQCPFCQENFTLIETMKKHIILSHSESFNPPIANAKPYKCQYCDASFALKANTKRHERRHTGEMPFQCQVCFKELRRKESLKDHMRIYHQSVGQ